ncbi:uncharacterized protein ACWYII_014796 isoform 3-T3 [Salvelinus alpinus]
MRSGYSRRGWRRRAEFVWRWRLSSKMYRDSEQVVIEDRMEKEALHRQLEKEHMERDAATKMNVVPSGVWKLLPRMNQTCGGLQFFV